MNSWDIFFPAPGHYRYSYISNP